MSEPLVTRNNDIQNGQPCLRGTRFPVGKLRHGIEAWGIHGCRTQYPALDAWTDEQLTEMTTYPRIETYLPAFSSDAIPLDTDEDCGGMFEVGGWFTPEESAALISAIQQAQNAIIEWRKACDEWEAQHR